MERLGFIMRNLLMSSCNCRDQVLRSSYSQQAGDPGKPMM